MMHTSYVHYIHTYIYVYIYTHALQHLPSISPALQEIHRADAEYCFKVQTLPPDSRPLYLLGDFRTFFFFLVPMQ